MSRKSKRSQLSLSQNQSQSQSQRNRTLTQQTLEESFGEVDINIDDHVNNLVRYIVNRTGSQLTLKQSEIKKNILPQAGVRYQAIVDGASKILSSVYGYNMILIDPTGGSSKEYVISNALPYSSTDPPVEEEIPDDCHKILLLLILSHIFMSNEVVSEVSLYAFLNSLKIDVERRHELFGNVKDYIHHTLKNKKYLRIEIEQISKKVSFFWGPRAEKEISKHEILKFVCKIYGDRLPNSWINQYKAADQQNFQNYKETCE